MASAPIWRQAFGPRVLETPYFRVSIECEQTFVPFLTGTMAMGRCADGDRGAPGVKGQTTAPVTAATLRNGFEARLARHGEPRDKPAGARRFVVG